MAKNLKPIPAVVPDLLADLLAAVASVPAGPTSEMAAIEPGTKTPKVALQTITVLVSANPKRPGTIAHRTFELYRTSFTTHEFVQQGGFGAALAWDVKHKFIKLG